MVKPYAYEPNHSARRVLAGDPWTAVLDEALGGLSGKIAAADVWKLIGKRHPRWRTQDDNFRLGEAMRALGWTRTMQRFGGQPISAYVKGTEASAASARCWPSSAVERRTPIYVLWDPVDGEMLVTQSTDPIRDGVQPVGWVDPWK